MFRIHKIKTLTHRCVFCWGSLPPLTHRCACCWRPFPPKDMLHLHRSSRGLILCHLTGYQNHHNRCTVSEVTYCSIGRMEPSHHNRCTVSNVVNLSILLLRKVFALNGYACDMDRFWLKHLAGVSQGLKSTVKSSVNQKFSRLCVRIRQNDWRSIWSSIPFRIDSGYFLTGWLRRFEVKFQNNLDFCWFLYQS